MDATHVGQVIIDQPQATDRIWGADVHFLAELSPHPLVIRQRRVGAIHRANMSPNANADLRVQPRLPLPLASQIAKQRHSPPGIPVTEHDVRNELLKGWVPL